MNNFSDQKSRMHEPPVFSNAIVEVAERLLSLQADTWDNTINFLLRRLGTLLAVDRGYVFRFTDDLKLMSNTHEWCADGIEPQRNRLQNMSTDTMPWWKEKMTQNKPVIIPAVSDLPAEAQGEREEFSCEGIQSLICLPLIDEKEHLLGFMGFDSVREPRTWSEPEVDMLSLTAHLLATAMGRSRAQHGLMEREALLDAAGSIARVGGWQIEVETMSVIWTKETYRIHEVPQHEKPPLDKAIAFFHPDDREALSQAIHRAIELGDPYDMELRFVTAKGRHLWTRTVCQPEVVDGKTVRLRGILHDITERKQAEEMNRKSAERAKRQSRLIAELTIDKSIVDSPIDEALQVIANRVAATMETDRASIWLLNNDNTKLERQILYDISSGSHSQVETLDTADIHSYLEAVRKDGQVAAEDAQSDIRTKELNENYLAPLNISSLLDTAIQRNGRVIGVLSVEHRGSVRQWHDDEKTFAGAIANLAAQLFSNAERKEAENKLKQNEWMLSKPFESSLENPEGKEPSDQEYGDLTQLNRNGLILRCVGSDMLAKIASEYMDLLGTSSAIYEANGDYAYGIFSSGWCRMLDHASRKLCETSDNAEALASGRWWCHESCWKDCSKEAMKRGEPVDIECAGGIRLYGMPVFANGEVIGSINFGYGDPPRDAKKLNELARTYNVDYEELCHASENYLSRPPYIIEMAKSRLKTSAQTIGLLVERRQAEIEREQLHNQLFQAQKMDSIGRLAGGVAHDFNNMLMVIMGETEMAMEQVSDNEGLRNSLNEIQKAANRSVDLTRQLLAFARRQTVEPKLIDLNETIESMLKMLRRLIGEDIDLVWRPGGSLNPVFVDPAQVDQILVNLCVNARDAVTEAGKITVETENVSIDEAYQAKNVEADTGEFVMLAVSDNGRGMESETLGQVFEPFFTTKITGEGTGLGLATVHGIVKQNKGFINVYSEPNQGTTFKIYLPRHLTRSASTPEELPVSTSAVNSETILLVEDEPAILKTTTRTLEGLGYTVITAAGPGEALRLAREFEGRIDLLITDVIMPEMNGRDLARNLMSLFPDIKRLFVSGYTANVIAHHGVLDAGVNFLQKPFSRNSLNLKIREALDRE